ncbi:SGNH/GDSL hydrolase family protein [Psychroserpens sp. BH13MA-6]
MTCWSCSTNNEYLADDMTNTMDIDTMDIDLTRSILSLGDSYTIGQSVCDTCRFPEQLKRALGNVTDYTIDLNVIAQTGWTTSDLINAIDNQTLESDYDLVTLLIGVNNQFQNVPFSVYESEFPELVQTAIAAANGNKDRIIIVSIPDYAFTVFGQNFGNPEETSQEIDMYNSFAENYALQEAITFVNITDITRLGLEQPSLVASDGLHPSELAYSKFVERLLPFAIQKLQ